jgi:hypothetical protein
VAKFAALEQGVTLPAFVVAAVVAALNAHEAETKPSPKKRR